MRKLSRSSAQEWGQTNFYYLTAPLVALVLAALLLPLRPFQQLEYLTVSARFQVRAPFDPPADPRLLLVGIDQQSLDNLGRFPWPRTVEADFLKTLALTQSGPHTVAFDIIFTEKSQNAADDAALADAAGQLPSVITGALRVNRFKDNPEMESQSEKETGAQLDQLGLTQPLPNIRGDVSRIYGSNIARFPVPVLRQQSLFGFVNDDASSVDAIRHTIPFVVRIGDKVFPSLSLQTLCQMLQVDPSGVTVKVGHEVVLENSSGKTWHVPIDESGAVTINYRNEESYRKTSFVNLTQTLEQAEADPIHHPIPSRSRVANTTILVGTTATGTTDLGPTPLQPHSPLVFTHLNVINSVLKNDYICLVPWYWVVSGWLVVTWATLFRLKEARLTEAVLAPVVVTILYAVAAFGIFWWRNYLMAMAWPVLAYGGVNFGAVVLRWREEQRGRQQIKQLFSRMLSPEVMDHLLAHPGNLKLGGADRHVTILFSDIRDYTKFSEGLSAAEVVRQLNVYFERMVDCVKEYRGTFHKYIGDAIMAAWGDISDASLGPKEDAQNAVRAALLMRRKLRELNEERQADGLMPLRIGIGLNHGDVLVGLIGAASRSEFTVMGDAVNTASRLEGMTKTFHTDLAVSESVCDLLENQFLVRRLGLIQLKGKTTPTVVYEVLAEKNDPAASKMSPETVARYEAAFDDFLARRFEQAYQGFLACEKQCPGDYCVQNYLQASRDFLDKAPDADWDGRMVMESK